MSNLSDKKKSLAFTILIGGKSQRFGSDKGLYSFNGKPLIMYQLEILSQFNHNIFIVAHSQKQIQNYVNNIDYRFITAFILDDKSIIRDKKIRSPLLGMFSAFTELKKLGYEKAFTLSCDMPLIKFDTIELLIKNAEGYDFCIPKWNNGYLEPLFAIYSIEKALIEIKKNLKNNIFRLLDIIDNNWKINYVSIENQIQPIDKNNLTFININNPIDLEKLIKLYQYNNLNK